MAKTPNVREMESRLLRLAKDIGVPLDAPLSSVDRTNEGIYRIVASSQSSPETEDERMWSQSALHACILDEFEADVGSANIDVHVLVPPVTRHGFSIQTVTTLEHSASVWIKQQLEGVHDMALQCTKTLARSCYTRVVEAYPWKSKDAMLSKIDLLVVRAVTNMSLGQTDPVMKGNVDAILPPIHGILPPFDEEYVRDDILRYRNGVPPDSILDLYETVFRAVHDPNVTTKTATITLYAYLFA